MTRMGQFQTHAPQHKNCTLLDDLTGEGEQSIRRCSAERFRSFPTGSSFIDWDDRKVGRLGAFEGPAGKVFCSISIAALTQREPNSISAIQSAMP
jgi:hypothetical protein